MKNFLAILISIGLLNLNAGCHEHHHHGPGGEPEHYSMFGEYYSTEKIPFEQAWGGSLKAMEELEFVVTKQEKDAISGSIVARGANDKKITVNLEKQSDELTEIRIWVGDFGDESMSRLILGKIKERANVF
jgi:hypothetical protein